MEADSTGGKHGREVENMVAEECGTSKMVLVDNW